MASAFLMSGPRPMGKRAGGGRAKGEEKFASGIPFSCCQRREGRLWRGWMPCGADLWSVREGWTDLQERDGARARRLSGRGRKEAFFFAWLGWTELLCRESRGPWVVCLAADATCGSAGGQGAAGTSPLASTVPLGGAGFRVWDRRDDLQKPRPASAPNGSEMGLDGKKIPIRRSVQSAHCATAAARVSHANWGEKV